MTAHSEDKPAAVPVGATQAGDFRHRWWWTEPTVWTDRMLTALENGVKGGKWFSLIDKVYSEANLLASYSKVAFNEGAPGVDWITVRRFGDNLESNLARLTEGLRNGSYRPQAVRRVWIPKPGSRQKRPLGIPTVRDRVVQTALRNVLEPIFEQGFAEHSYGFRPGRSCKDALRRVDELLKAGYRYVVDADLKSYFDTIPHDKLMSLLGEKVSDSRVLSLIKAFLKQGVMDGLREWTPEEGSPQGAVISPLLSNVYLNPLDRQMADEGFAMVRYADDFVILCQSREDAQRALARIEQWTAEAGLTLHPDKTRIVDAKAEGFDFLGYHFERGTRWPRKKSLHKLKASLRAKTKRTNGHCLNCIITNVNWILRGWFGYFRHSHWTTFEPIDQWVRMRLRSILRRRRGGKGRGRGTDHYRWPNSYFAEHGLYSLKLAHVRASQSC